MANQKETIQKMYYTQLIVVVALLAVVIGLAGTSIISFFQTEKAFVPLNDPTIVMFGFQAGNWISYLFAMSFQYGQNAALYIKRKFCSDNIILKSELPFIGEIEIRDNTIADIVFWSCCLVDSLTNVLWFHQSVEIPSDAVLGWMLRIIGYSAMIGSVFAEEAIGVVLDALRKAGKELNEIRASEKRMKAKEFNATQSQNVPSSLSPNSPNSNNSYSKSYPNSQIQGQKSESYSQNKYTNPLKPHASINQRQE